MSTPHLSKVRTVLFGGMVLVWFTEMSFLGFPGLSRVWAYLWQVPVPESTELSTALYLTWATAAPAKGALGVMAVVGLLSKNPRARRALFVSMALVPPLNIAFPFRDQGFLFGPVAVATTLSAILWVSFFLFKEPVDQSKPQHSRPSVQFSPSRWEIFQYAWFALYSLVLTALAVLFLFWPETALRLTLPRLFELPGTQGDGIASLIHAGHASGTHLLAVAIGFWIATVNCRSNSVLRRALTATGITHAGLFLVFPWRQLLLKFGTDWATSSVLIGFIPLFIGWVLYAALSWRAEPARAAPILR